MLKRVHKIAALLTATVIVCCAGSAFAESFEETMKKAQAGDAEAQYLVGMYYAMPLNLGPVPTNYVEAAKWHRKAAEQGVADAQYCLAEAYYRGEGVKQDYVEADKWYRKAYKQFRVAAEHGDTEVLYRLADMYYMGKGVTQNYAEADKWYRKAYEYYRTYHKDDFELFIREDIEEKLKFLSNNGSSALTVQQSGLDVHGKQKSSYSSSNHKIREKCPRCDGS